MKTLKTFMAGMVFPATFLPLIYTFFFLQGNPEATKAPLALASHLAPLFMGLWNILAIRVKSHTNFKDTRLTCTASGMVLGIIAGIIATFCYPIMEHLFGIEGVLKYLPLIFYPVFFALIFRYVVHPLNKEFGVY